MQIRRHRWRIIVAGSFVAGEVAEGRESGNAAAGRQVDGRTGTRGGE